MFFEEWGKSFTKVFASAPFLLVISRIIGMKSHLKFQVHGRGVHWGICADSCQEVNLQNTWMKIEHTLSSLKSAI